MNTTPTEFVDAKVMQAAREIRAEAMNAQDAEHLNTLRLNRLVGAINAHKVNETFNRLAILKDFAEIKENKAYRGATVEDRKTGRLVTVTSWEEFCSACGYTVNTINNDLNNLAVFGMEFLEAAHSIGLGVRELRMLRAGWADLTAEERRELAEETRAAQTPEEVKEVKEMLSIHLKALTKEKKELEKTLREQNKLAETRNKQIDDLTVQVQKLEANEGQPDRERDDERIRKLGEACSQALVAVSKMTEAARTILDDDTSGPDAVSFVHANVASWYRLMSGKILDAGVDVQVDAAIEPDWLPVSDEPNPVMILPDDVPGGSED